MNIRIIVPRRADRGHRDRLWAYCRAYWEKELPGVDIVEGHHDNGPFNRSAAINLAARGRWDIAVILDADVILDTELVTAAIDHATRTGHMVLPFHRRVSVNESGTTTILAGYAGSWANWVAEKQTFNVSTCVVVPRSLWDNVGGFDERFEGWGGEDDAFHAACKALAGVTRLKGDAWHLWHPVSPWRDHRSGLYRQAKALSDRYVATKSKTAMRKLLAEPRDTDQVALVVLTTGTRETLADTIDSATKRLDGPIGRRILALNNRNTKIARSLAEQHPEWDIELVAGTGYCNAVRGAINTAIGSGQPWIFWLEDDFTFNEDIDLWPMQTVMERNPQLVQLSLKRQPWYEHELAAGGIIEANPSAFRQHEGFITLSDDYISHREYWTMNPMLCRREFLAAHTWPKPPDCERRFGRQIFTDPNAYAGIFGTIDHPPRVTHIGEQRAGKGY